MKNRTKTALIFGFLAVALAGYGVGRAQDENDSASQLREAFLKAEDGPEGYGPLTELIAKLPGDVPMTKLAIRKALAEASTGKDTNSNAVIISQNAKIIEQNAQMIALLKQIAAKK